MSDNSKGNTSLLCFRIMGTCIVLLIVSIILANIVGDPFKEIAVILSFGSGGSLVAGIIAAIWGE